MSDSNFLEKWAYIMIIIVCFTILFTIIFYFINLILKKKFCSNIFSNINNHNNTSNNNNNSDGSNNDKCKCCSSIHLKSEKCNIKNLAFPLQESNDNNNINNNMSKPKIEKSNSPEMSTKSNSFDMNSNANSSLTNPAEPEDGFFYQLIKRLKSSFFSDSSLDDDDEDKKLQPDNANNNSIGKTTTGSSVITENESEILKNVSKKRTSFKQKNRRSTLLNNANLNLVKLSNKPTNLALKDQEKYSSDECLPGTSTRHYLPKSGAKKTSFSLASSCASRKNSTNSSCYTEPSVVDYYRKKRYSNASSVLTTNTSISDLKSMDSRKCSIAQPSIKLVTLEQQPNIFSNMMSLPKKSSISSVSTSSSSRYSASGRRYSIMTSNLSEKFWVPAEIAKSAQLDKQRGSLPNTADVIFEQNEKIKTKHRAI